VGEARVNATASSQVTVWVTRALEANASRSANVSYYGAPAQVTKNESSSGSVEALGDK
jgi:hypothetical protein